MGSNMAKEPQRKVSNELIARFIHWGQNSGKRKNTDRGSKVKGLRISLPFGLNISTILFSYIISDYLKILCNPRMSH